MKRFAIVFILLVLSGCASVKSSQQSPSAQPQPTAVGTQRDSVSNDEALARPQNPIRSIPIPEQRRYKVERIGNLDHRLAQEVSGLAVSNHQMNRFWMINDSGNSSDFLTFDLHGNFITSFATGLTNRDWEDLAGFSLDNTHYLLVGDIGDNLRVHPHYSLSLFIEPDENTVLHSYRVGTAGKRQLEPIVTTRFVFPDGKHNCEAMAVSLADRQIILITKSGDNAGVYTLPLKLEADEESPDKIVTATKVGNLSTIPQSTTDRIIGNIAGVNLAQATALEINAESNTAFLLTYRGVYRWVRQSIEQDWGSVFSQPAQLLTRHSMTQAEAIALSNKTGQIYVISENIPSPILQLTPVLQDSKATKSNLL